MKKLPSLLSLITTIAILACAAIPALAAETVRQFKKDLPTGDARRVHLDFPVGELVVEGAAGAQVALDVHLTCKHSRDACREAAQKVRLVYSTDGDALVVRMRDWPKWSGHGLEARIHVQVPRALPLKANLGVGELRISAVASDVTADLGVGEVRVTMPAGAVGSVHADTGVGEAVLVAGGRRYESAGLFGRRVTWKEGKGAATVRVDCGVGEVDVRLQ